MARRTKATLPEVATKPAVKRAFDFEAIRSVSRASRLLDVNISRFSGEATRPVVGLQAYGLRQRMAFRGARHEAPPELVIASAEFEFTVHDTDSTLLLTVKGAAFVVYALARAPDDGISEDAISEFAEANGLYHAWPFLRELVSSATARLGLSGVLLPIWTPPKDFPAAGDYHEIVFEPQAQ